MVCLISRNDPRALRGLTREQYLAARHVVPLPYSPVAARRRRDASWPACAWRAMPASSCRTSSWRPTCWSNTDLVFTTARHFAEHFARLLPLAVVRRRSTFRACASTSSGTSARTTSPAHRWFRGLLSDAARRMARADSGLNQPLPRAAASRSTASASSASSGPSTCTLRDAAASTSAQCIGNWSPPNKSFMTSFDAA